MNIEWINEWSDEKINSLCFHPTPVRPYSVGGDVL